MRPTVRVNLLGDALRWVRSARRENERRAQAAPLLWFGGLVPQTTAREREQRFGPAAAAARATAWREWEAAQEAKADQARGVLSLLLTPDEVRGLDEQRGKYPPTSEYSAEHWCGALRRWFQMRPVVSAVGGGG